MRYGLGCEREDDRCNIALGGPSLLKALRRRGANKEYHVINTF
jgi:hypothetical protein